MKVIKGITRVEVIKGSERVYVEYDIKECMLSSQDNGKTLKIFIKGKEDETTIK